jgi:hypothetical protein
MMYVTLAMIRDSESTGTRATHAGTVASSSVMTPRDRAVAAAAGGQPPARAFENADQGSGLKKWKSSEFKFFRRAESDNLNRNCRGTGIPTRAWHFSLAPRRRLSAAAASDSD